MAKSTDKLFQGSEPELPFSTNKYHSDLVFPIKNQTVKSLGDSTPHAPPPFCHTF